MIKLTEIAKRSTGIHEIPVLINPEHMVLIQSSELIKEETPIIGTNDHIMSIRIIPLTNGKFVTVAETTDEILDIIAESV